MTENCKYLADIMRKEKKKVYNFVIQPPSICTLKNAASEMSPAYLQNISSLFPKIHAVNSFFKLGDVGKY